MEVTKSFPEGMVPIDGNPFPFSCHPKVRCYTICCKNVELILYPYDIIKLKSALSISSTDFLKSFARLIKGENPYFPTVMLKVRSDGDKACPFLSDAGCTVYKDRPSACRMYPLERAVDRIPVQNRLRDYYFIVKHPYCYGHEEKKQNTVREWIRDQRLEIYNVMNELWTEIDTVFMKNPWQGESVGGNRQQLAFMVCYDIDRFRSFVKETRLIEQFSLSKNIRREIEGSDVDLMKFGFEWLKLILTGKSALVKR
jgi:hypothetical protein